MLDCRYVSRLQDVEFAFQAENNRINASDIRDYEWSYDERFNKVKQFSQGLTTRTIPVIFFQRMMSGRTDELYKSPEEMYEIMDRDVRELSPGQLWIGEYFIDCYIIGSQKNIYDNGKIIKMTLTVLSDFNWHMVQGPIPFGYTTAGGGGGTGEDSDYLDFEYDFEYDYYSDGLSGFEQIRTKAIAPFKFRLVFEGPVEDPTFQIGDNIYRVYISLHSGEQLVIDSREKKVYRVLSDGISTVNEFNNRDRDHYIFQPMPISKEEMEVVLQEDVKCNLTAYIERSEPTWI